MLEVHNRLSFKIYFYLYRCASVSIYGVQRPEEGIGPLELEVKEIVSHLTCWKLNMVPLEEQLVLFTVEPSL